MGILVMRPLPYNPNPVLKLVDNSGDGNCMYYAYSFSLMYYLRTFQMGSERTRVTDALFTRLNLNDTDKRLLINLLDSSQGEFKPAQLKLIERILGPAARNATSNAIVDELIEVIDEISSSDFAEPDQRSLEATSLYASIAFRFRKEFLKKINPKAPQLPEIPDFTNAEIFRVPGINKRIGDFIAKNQLPELPQDSNFDVNFDKFIMRSVVDFFKQNNNQELENYRDHLNIDRRWATEEEALVLTRYLRNERRIGSIGNVRFVSDINLDLSIIPPKIEPLGNIILQNNNNVHWVSLIPSNYIQPILFPEVPSALSDQLLLTEFNEEINQFSTQVDDVKKIDIHSEDYHRLKELMNQFVNKDIRLDSFHVSCQQHLNTLIDVGSSPEKLNEMLDLIFQTVQKVLQAPWYQPDPVLEGINKEFNIQLTRVEQLDYRIYQSDETTVFMICVDMQNAFEQHLKGKVKQEAEFRNHCLDLINKGQISKTSKTLLMHSLNDIMHRLDPKHYQKPKLSRVENIIKSVETFQQEVQNVIKRLPNKNNSNKERKLYNKLIESIWQSTAQLIKQNPENLAEESACIQRFKTECEDALLKVNSSLYKSKITAFFSKFMNAICTLFSLPSYDPVHERLSQLNQSSTILGNEKKSEDDDDDNAPSLKSR